MNGLFQRNSIADDQDFAGKCSVVKQHEIFGRI